VLFRSNNLSLAKTILFLNDLIMFKMELTEQIENIENYPIPESVDDITRMETIKNDLILQTVFLNTNINTFKESLTMYENKVIQKIKILNISVDVFLN